MKKIITFFIAVFICSISMAQSWDYLKRDFALNRSDVSYFNNSVKYPVYEKSVNFYGDVSKRIIDYKTYELAPYIYEEYRMGWKCYRAGCATISVGVPFVFTGGILFGCAQGNPSRQEMLIAGEVFMGVGASLVSISLPLLMFGDHMKREANWHYRMIKK